MNPAKPLQGYRVLVTRGKEQSAPLIETIEKLGGVPFTVPLIDFVMPEAVEQAEQLIAGLDSYDWLVFTSQNGVHFFFEFFNNIGFKLSLPKIAVIGTKTRDALSLYGLEPDFLPTEFVAERFVEEFVPVLNPISRVLVAKGNLARSLISDTINRIAACDEVTVYQTVTPSESESQLMHLLAEEGLDVVTFTSPSTVFNFIDIVKKYELDKKIKNLTFVSIGPVATKAAEKCGLEIAASPDVYTAEAMVESLVYYLQRNKIRRK
jgi:uroporphyrinogen-III synthase